MLGAGCLWMLAVVVCLGSDAQFTVYHRSFLVVVEYSLSLPCSGINRLLYRSVFVLSKHHAHLEMFV
jgi:hypothetical protein